MMQPDVRWKQRFQNYVNALAELSEAIELQQQRPLSKLEKQGFVKAFEFTHELAWNVIKDYFFYQGNSQIMGSRDATREAFQKGLITDGDNWMRMIKTRNKAVHTYDEEMAREVIETTTTLYYPLFVDLEKVMAGLALHD
ncbi:MAG: nucleotidyltransferase substrate binding protein [Gammaproteobacteria bacterium]|nr:nucleotidyltransferase substrate binding protein [Gammaproteobacteria bacterium]MDQ7076084.1 nucleotidyltransferase substrate binding protein [Gammaproteobacteria bacterium]